MFHFIFLLVISSTFAGTIQDKILPPLDGRIVGGIDTTIQSHPYQVSIQLNGRHYCGGSLYRNDIVITAAHCLQNNIPVRSISVRLGSTIHSSGGVVTEIASYANHPNYTSFTNANDIAIIRLASSVSQTKTIQTIDLATSTPAAGTVAVVTGWGTKKEGIPVAPNILQKLVLKVLNNKQCSSDSYKYGSMIKNSMICAFTTGKDSCQGDSGGPLVAGGKLVGVVSWGYGCARPGYPGVYSDVAVLRSWIEYYLRK